LALHPDFLALSSPIKVDITIVQGDSRSFLRTLRKKNMDGTYTPYDITGWSFRLQVRAAYTAISPVLIAATVAPTANAALGEYSEAWSPSDTAALWTNSSNALGIAPLGYYDLEVISGSDVITLKRGKANLLLQISKA